MERGKVYYMSLRHRMFYTATHVWKNPEGLYPNQVVHFTSPRCKRTSHISLLFHIKIILSNSILCIMQKLHKMTCKKIAQVWFNGVHARFEVNTGFLMTIIGGLQKSK